MKKTKEMCRGCYNNFYNGNNSYGVKECWSFKDAKIIDRIEVSIHEFPPYDKKRKRKFLNCFHRQGYAYIRPENLNNDGYIS